MLLATGSGFQSIAFSRLPCCYNLLNFFIDLLVMRITGNDDY
jgi:hypothetical protein